MGGCGQLAKSTLIAHDLVAPRLLPDGERTRHEHELAAIQGLYLHQGLDADLPEIVRTLGVDPAATNAEPDLKGLSTRILSAFGRTTPRTVFDYECATALAALLDRELQELPGGHNGNTTHPRAYAARIREILNDARRPKRPARRPVGGPDALHRTGTQQLGSHDPAGAPFVHGPLPRPCRRQQRRAPVRLHGPAARSPAREGTVAADSVEPRTSPCRRGVRRRTRP
ncbi:hypothetical protein SALBM311S_08495 [Streptomyces alboniger]